MGVILHDNIRFTGVKKHCSVKKACILSLNQALCLITSYCSFIYELLEKIFHFYDDLLS